MKFAVSKSRSKSAVRTSNKERYITALFLFGLSLLFSLLPMLYSLPKKPAGRLTLFLILALIAAVLFVFLLRYLYYRLHGENTDIRGLLLPIVAGLTGLLVGVLLSVLITMLLFSKLQLPIMEEVQAGAETIAAAGLNAVLFPLIICAPMAGLAAGAFGNGFWRRYGKLLMRGYLPILGAAILCYGLTLFLSSAFSGFLGSIVSALFIIVLYVFAIEWTIVKTE